MNHRIAFHTTGGTEVLDWVEAPLRPPGPGEARVRNTAIGVNFIDVYHRVGLYPLPLPSGLGLEAAGVVEALGPGTSGLAVGQRVAHVDGPVGAYAEARNHPAARLVPLPDTVSDEAAAALIFKGLTTHMLVRRVWRPVPEAWVLVHAAAGGVGLILTRWLAMEGARVIGVVSTPEKAEAVKAEGAQAVIILPRGGSYPDLVPQVRDLTGGSGVRVAFDSVGRESLEASLDCLGPFGLLVSFGQASGTPPAVEISTLGRRGSLALQRPSVMHHVAAAEDLQAAALDVFEAHARGILPAHIHARLPLREAARAHQLLESRATQGSLVLIP